MRELDAKWTEGQRKAIRLRGRTLLVSAAAGSGKTAVLTERIIDRLLAEDEQLELTKLLCVTFTRAAATELRNRIRAALEKEIAKDPSNARLQEQLLAVGRAKISTIDSFYLDLIRAHAEEIGISPKVRVEDAAQIALLEKTVMNGVIEDYYSDTNIAEAYRIADFASFCTLFSSAKRENDIVDVFLSLYRTLTGYIDGVDFLLHTANGLRALSEKEITADDALFAPIFEKCQSLCDTYLPRMADILAYLSQNEVQNAKVGPTYSAIYLWLSELQALLSAHADYGRLHTHFQNYEIPGFKALKGDNITEQIEAAREIRDKYKVRQNAIKETFFSLAPDDVRRMTLSQSDILLALHKLLSVYRDRLWTEKKRKNIVDFPDLARLSLALLYDEKAGGPSETAREIKEYYSEIYIDEYQDTSEVQDLIFRLIAREDNRFMVGDAKQSIYGFRGAVPDGFLRYRKQFSDDASSGTTVFLSDNFRCNEQIIRFSNMVFSLLFGVGGGVPYEDDDALIFSKPVTDSPVQKKVPIALFSNDKITEEDEDDEDDVEQSESAWVADRILWLLEHGRLDNGARIRMRDIAILLRSTKTGAAPFAEALEARGISTYNTANTAFFENAEVSLVYSLLSVIDNPQKDIHLAAVLKSPLYGLTLDELIFIRRSYPEGSLYDALCAFCEKTGFARGSYFLSRIAHYRHVSRGMPVDRFLWYLYGDTGILSTVYQKEQIENNIRSTDPVRMRANLMMLYEYARTFEAGHFGGLYAFVLFITDVIENKASLPTAQLTGEESDAVRIMTIHQSKGLEFPVCFVAGLGKKRSTEDLKQPILLSQSIGAASRVQYGDTMIQYEHPYQACVKDRIKTAKAEEEWRTLYVALTRAREQLYLSATLKDAQKALQKARTIAAMPDKESIRAIPTYAECILAALMAQENDFDGYEILMPDRAGTEMPEQEMEVSSADDPALEMSDDMPLVRAKQLVRERLSYIYPDEARTQLPMKLGVSSLLRMRDSALEDEQKQSTGENTDMTVSPTDMLSLEYAYPTEAPPVWETECYADDTYDREYIPCTAEAYEDIPLPDDSDVVLPTAPLDAYALADADEVTPAAKQRSYAKPRFMETAPQAPSAAERGTATHTFMQFCNLSALSEEGVEDEIERLVQKGFITVQTAEMIDRYALRLFTRSALFDRLKGAREIHRELRFNLFVGAKALTDPHMPLTEASVSDEGEARMLLQGVIDCYFVDKDGRLVLLDYKTDHFPRTLRETPGAVEAILSERYKDQLTVYKAACEQLTLRIPDEIRIYSFALGRDFELGEMA